MALVVASPACEGPVARSLPALTPAAAPTSTAPAPAAPQVEPVPVPVPPPLPPQPRWMNLPSGGRAALLPVVGRETVDLVAIFRAGGTWERDQPGLPRLTAMISTALPTPQGNISMLFGPDGVVFRMVTDRANLKAASLALASRLSGTSFRSDDWSGGKQRFDTWVAEQAANDRAAATAILRRDLYILPIHLHPYGRPPVTAEETAQLTLVGARRFAQTHYRREGVAWILAGDLTEKEAALALEQATKKLPAGRPPEISFTEVEPRHQRRVSLIHRSGAETTHLFLGALGPRPMESAWPSVRTLTALVDGSITALEGGPSLVVIHKKAERGEVADVAQALIETLPSLVVRPPTEDLVNLSLSKVYEQDRIDGQDPVAILGRWAQNYLIRLPPENLGFPEAISPEYVSHAAEWLGRRAPVVVGVGDADKIAEALSIIGDVHVLDPNQDFARVRTVQATEPKQ